MPATKGRPGGTEPDETGADRTAATTPAGKDAVPAPAVDRSVEEKRARGQETRAKQAAAEQAREERLARAEQKRAGDRSAAKVEAEESVRRPVGAGSAEDLRRQKADEKRVKKELGITEPSPRWWAPLMVTLMVLGLLWVVVFYVSNMALPIKSLGNWNILVGFALMLVGFAMTTRWR